MKVNDSAGRSLAIDEAIFGQFDIANKREFYFVGEAIPVTVSVFVLDALKPQLSQLPTFDGADDILLKSYQWENGQSANFDMPIYRRTIHNGRNYIKFDFKTVMRPLKPGKIDPKASLTINIADTASQNRRSSAFDFFMGANNYKPYTLSFAPSAPFTVKPLPPAPAEAIYLGLIGNWQLNGNFDQATGKVGEALTLSLKLEGNGDADTLLAPKLTLAYMRVFPPEVQKNNSDIQIRYAIVPLKAETLKTELKFATFNPDGGKYEIHPLTLNLPVKPSDIPLTPAYSTSSPEVLPDNAADPQRKVAPLTQLAPRADINRTVRLPLWRDSLPLAIGIVLVAGIIAGAIELLARHKHRMTHDSEYKRARLLKRETPKIVAKLQSIRSESELLEFFNSQIYPLLAEALRLPRGASPSEIIAKVDDDPLRKLLEAEMSAQYMPGVTRKNLFNQENIELLVKGITRYTKVLLILVFALPMLALGVTNTDVTSPATEAFSAQDYPKALVEYRKILNDRTPSPDVLYNLGQCAFFLKDLPLAKGYLERAHRLAPRDPAIAENLRMIDEYLKLPQKPNAKLNSYRDYLRPDEYLLLGAVALSVLLLTIALRRNFSPAIFRYSVTIAIVIIVLSATVIAFQLHSTYCPDSAIAIGQNPELRSLPGDSSGNVLATIPGGSEVKIIDRNGDFSRIELNGQDGWIPSKKLMPLF
jgi:tetratricopeptide (TPR) repeat protein